MDLDAALELVQAMVTNQQQHSPQVHQQGSSWPVDASSTLTAPPTGSHPPIERLPAALQRSVNSASRKAQRGPGEGGGGREWQVDHQVANEVPAGCEEAGVQAVAVVPAIPGTKRPRSAVQRARDVVNIRGGASSAAFIGRQEGTQAGGTFKAKNADKASVRGGGDLGGNTRRLIRSATSSAAEDSSPSGEEISLNKQFKCTFPGCSLSFARTSRLIR
jgi:hypothetical protein